MVRVNSPPTTTLHLPVDVEDKIKEFIGDTRIVINPLVQKKYADLRLQNKVIYQEMKLHLKNYR